MAKRSVTNVAIDGTSYNMMILNDFTPLNNYIVYGQFETNTEYSTTNNTDFAPIKADASSTTSYNTDLGSAKFLRMVGTYMGLAWDCGQQGSSLGYVEYQGTGTHAYYSIILDDDIEEAWVVVKVYQNNIFDKMIIYYGDAGLYNDIYKAPEPEPPSIISSSGAGSGYIGNPLLSNKKMNGYNVPTSFAIDTFTFSTTKHSNAPISGYAKQGNGFVKITYLGPVNS